MKRIIETSKGEFIITDDLEKINHWINNGRYEYICQVRRCNEKEASSIVQQSIHTKLYAHYVKDIEVNTFCYESAIESIHSLLESHNIEITNNTYIFKV